MSAQNCQLNIPNLIHAYFTRILGETWFVIFISDFYLVPTRNATMQNRLLTLHTTNITTIYIYMYIIAITIRDG